MSSLCSFIVSSIFQSLPDNKYSITNDLQMCNAFSFLPFKGQCIKNIFSVVF